jgi:Dienelactone hydrolase family
MKHLPALLTTSIFAFASAHATLVEKTVIYQQGGVTLEGFHVYDDAVTGKRPAVLVIHQWTGLSDYEKRRSRMLAELGYNVFAADCYGQGIRPQPPAAGQEAGKYKGDRALFRARLLAALDLLKTDERTDAKKVLTWQPHRARIYQKSSFFMARQTRMSPQSRWRSSKRK